MNALGFGVSSLALLVLWAAAGDNWFLPTRPGAMIALLYLVTVGSLGLFMLVLTIACRWTASTMSYTFALFSVAAMGLEWLLLGEPVAAAAGGAASIMIVGAWIGELAPTPPLPDGLIERPV